MKKIIVLLVLGAILIGVGSGLALIQIRNGGLDVSPINDFFEGVFGSNLFSCGSSFQSCGE